MEATAQHDEQFLKWILSREAETYWAFDRHGKRLKLKAGWNKAQAEYDRITGLKENSENDLKVCDIPSSIQ